MFIPLCHICNQNLLLMANSLNLPWVVMLKMDFHQAELQIFKYRSTIKDDLKNNFAGAQNLEEEIVTLDLHAVPPQ